MLILKAILLTIPILINKTKPIHYPLILYLYVYVNVYAYVYGCFSFGAALLRKKQPVSPFASRRRTAPQSP